MAPASTVPASAAILCVGRELLRGRTRDGNAHYLAGRLTSVGVPVERISVADDRVEAIAREILSALSLPVRFLVTTGGLGPTFDDLTLEGLARAVGARSRIDAAALEAVRAAYRDLRARGLVASAGLTPEREKMARFPAGARPHRNRAGAAPAVALEARGATIYCLPGVPEEMKVVWREEIEPAIVASLGSSGAAPLGEIAREVELRSRDESSLAPLLRELASEFPAVYPKSRVSGSKEKIRIVVTLATSESPDATRLLREAARRLRALAASRGLGAG